MGWTTIRVRGQTGAPNLPEAAPSPSEAAVFAEAWSAFGGDGVAPTGERRLFAGEALVLEKSAQLVEVVDFAEEILQALQVVTPFGMPLGEKDFNGVAEALDADAQGVPGGDAAAATGANMKGASVLVALEGQAARDGAVRRNETRALAEDAGQPLPMALVETRQSQKSFLARGALALGENLFEGGADGAVGAAELFGPLNEDLGVAKGAEAAEEFPAGFTEVAPSWVGIDFGEDGSNGAAAAQGHAEVVDGFGVLADADAVDLVEDTTHPELQTSMRGFLGDGMCNGRSHRPNLRGRG